MTQIRTEISSQDINIPIRVVELPETSQSNEVKSTSSKLLDQIYNFKFRDHINTRNFITSSILLLFGLTLTYRTVNAIHHNHMLQSKLANLESESEYLKLKNKNLVLNKNYYQSPEYLSKAAKSKLNLIESGEKVVFTN